MKKRLNTRSLRRFGRNTDGAMAVEFAMILPIFLTMLFGTLEIGNVLYAKSTLQQGIETAGRYAMVHIDASVSEIQAEAISAVSHLGSLQPVFVVEQTSVNGITYSIISVSAQYSVITPLFSGQTIDLSSSMSVPQTDPADFS